MRRIHGVGSSYINQQDLEYTVTKMDGEQATLVFSKSGYSTVRNITTASRGKVIDESTLRVSGTGLRNKAYLDLLKKYRDKSISKIDKEIFNSWRNMHYRESRDEVVIDKAWHDIEVYSDYYKSTKPITDLKVALTYNPLQKYYKMPKHVGPDTATWLTLNVLNLLDRRYTKDSHLESAVKYRPGTDSYSVISIDGTKVAGSGLNELEAEKLALKLRMDKFDENLAILGVFERSVLQNIVDEYVSIHTFTKRNKR